MSLRGRAVFPGALRSDKPVIAMDQPNLLPGISSSIIETSRLKTHVLTSGDAAADSAPVIFIHGNVSGSRFWEETMLALPKGLRAIALDLRGFGDSEAKPIDATRGLRDFADDLHALIAHPSVAGDHGKVHLVGWSAGAGVAMQYAIDHTGRVASITLVAPMSPYGFGGTKDAVGAPCFSDFAGSGGGTANPEFVKNLAMKDAGESSDFSPRNVMNKFYFKPPFRSPREDVFVAEMLKMRISDDIYPGDSTPSPNWPNLAPGHRGMNNALSPAYCDVSKLASIDVGPEVVWIRGADDSIVSDTSLFDFGYLGQLGAVPGWPGAEIYPAQPMVAQTRAVLDAYRRRGGRVREEVLQGVAHSPHIEAPDAFNRLLAAALCGEHR
jgi:pimeloyl-ACP methyl ester carboxylesterase